MTAKVATEAAPGNDQAARQPGGGTAAVPELAAKGAREPMLSAGLLEAATGSVESQRARLNDPQQHFAQRQALARGIGHVHGNFHLQKVISALRQETAAHQSPASPDIDETPAEQRVASLSEAGSVARSEPGGDVSKTIQRSTAGGLIQRRTDSSSHLKRESAPKASARREPLNSGRAERFGKQLGADFGSVMIHTGDEVAESRGAAAIAYGRDLHFADGALERSESEELLGHELVHTIQQGAVPTRRKAPATPADAASAEAEAERVGRAAARGEPGSVTLQAPSASQGKSAPAGAEAAGAHARPAPAAAAHARIAEVDARIAKERADALRAQRQKRPPTPALPRAAAPASKEAPKAPPAPQSRRVALPGQPVTKKPAAAGAKARSTGTPRAARGAATAQASAVAVSAAPTPAAPAPAPVASSPATAALDAMRGPSASRGREVAAEGARIAAQIRSRAAAAAAAIRSAGQEGSAELHSARKTATAQIDADVAGGDAAIKGSEGAAAGATGAAHAAAAASITSAGTAQNAQVAREAEQHKSQAPQTAAEKKATVEAAADSEAARFRQASDDRGAKVQDAPSGGGEAADSKEEAAQKAGAQASTNFSQDALRVEQGNREAAGTFASFIGDQVANFVSSVEGVVPKVTGYVDDLVDSGISGLASAATKVTRMVAGLAGQASEQIQAGAAGVIHGVESGVEALAGAVGSHGEQYAAEVVAQAEKLASTVEQSAQEAGLTVAAAPEATATELALQARAQMNDFAGQAATELAGAESRVAGQFGKKAQEGVAAIASATGATGAHLKAGAEGAAGKIAAGQAVASHTFQNAAQGTSQQLAEAGAQASTDLTKAGADFASTADIGAGHVKAELAKTADQASDEQQGNLGKIQGKTHGTLSEIDSQYSSLKSEADSKSAADQQKADDGGQRFLEWILPKSWTAGIKDWFKNTFGEILGGILYGLLSALVPLLIIGGLCLLFEAAAPFIIIGALIVGLVLGIYSRFSNFKNDNGRGPGFWEGLALVGLGIADLTGIPQIVEGIVGYRAFAMHNPDGSLREKMSNFERAEMITSGIVQLITLGLGMRTLKGRFGAKPEIKPTEVKPPSETKPPESKPPEERPSETRPAKVLSRAERLQIFYERLRAAPRPKNAEAALEQIRRILNEVEDEHSGVPKADPPPGPGTSDGRMYPPLDDFVTRSPDGSITARTRAHTIEIGSNGEVRITNRKTGAIDYERR
jgi:hypothetical protein